MIKHSFLLTAVLMLLLSCGGTDEQVQMASVGETWPKNSWQKFEFNITEAQQPKNIIFVVRNNNDYPYSNIRLIVKAMGPNKFAATDTLNYILAEPNGRWLGAGFGETKETLFQYKLNQRFPADGRYSFQVQQAMRMDSLPGIEDIGIKIETAAP